MSPARRFALALARISFRLLLVLTITLWALLVTFGTGTDIKRALVDTKTYDQFVPVVLESNLQQSKVPTLFNDPEVRKITAKAFNPQLLQRTSETFIDTAYAWLNGQEAVPAFTFDFTVQRQQLAEQLSIYAMERLSALPVCTAFEANISLDPFQATCQPAGVNYRQEQLNLQDQLLSSDEFLPKVIYTEKDLPKTQSGKTVAEAFSYAPLGFQLMRPALYVLTSILLILAFMTVALRPVKRNGWKELGKTLFMSGAFLAISGIVFGLIVPHFSRSFQSQFVGNGTDKLFGDVVQSLSVTFETAFINTSLQIAAAGGVILILLKLVKPGSRYKSLEHVTGLVNGIKPTIDTLTAKRAISAPVTTSERQKVHLASTKSKGKKSKYSKEIV